MERGNSSNRTNKHKKCVGTINKLTNLWFCTQHHSEDVTISICFPLSLPAGCQFRMAVEVSICAVVWLGKWNLSYVHRSEIFHLVIFFSITTFLYLSRESNILLQACVIDLNAQKKDKGKKKTQKKNENDTECFCYLVCLFDR